MRLFIIGVNLHSWAPAVSVLSYTQQVIGQSVAALTKNLAKKPKR